jgi:hypothetical protein
LHDLLLGVGHRVPPLIHDLDANVAAGKLLEVFDEVLHGGRKAQIAIGVGQP